MPIVYLCSTGAYASLVAANLYLGTIDLTCRVEDILQLPNFGELPGMPGFFLYVGKDSRENMIYTLGISNEAELIKKSTYDLLQILGHDSNKIRFCDVSGFSPGRHLAWCNAIFPRLSKRFIARKLHQRLPLMKKEIEKFSKQGL